MIMEFSSIKTHLGLVINPNFIIFAVFVTSIMGRGLYYDTHNSYVLITSINEKAKGKT